MADQRIELTDKSVYRIPFASDGQLRVRDIDLKGFFVLVGKHTKTYMAQGEFWSNGVRVFSARVKLGEYGEFSARDARSKAKDILGMIARGDRPGEPRPDAVVAPNVVVAASPPAEVALAQSGITLREAWERYRVSHLVRQNRSAGTIANYVDHVERLFIDWLDTPLRELADDPERVADRHDAITEANGPYIANACMRSLRAIYNHAWSKNKRLLPPDNPVDAVDWNPEERRDTGMGVKDLPGWFDELAALENPIRREYHLFTLLSGCRPTALKHARPEHLDLKRRTLHISNPKGGKKRAFDIPLSRQMIACLLRAIRYGRFLHPIHSDNWLFPADSESGHLEEHKEDRKVLSKWGNDLRQSFRTLATVAGLSEVDAKLLMNHKMAGVNEGYITRHKLLEDHLRGQQQAVSGVVFGPVRDSIASAGAIRMLVGPRAARRTIDAAMAAETTKRTAPKPYPNARRATAKPSEAGPRDSDRRSAPDERPVKQRAQAAA